MVLHSLWQTCLGEKSRLMQFLFLALEGCSVDVGKAIRRPSER